MFLKYKPNKALREYLDQHTQSQQMGCKLLGVSFVIAMTMVQLFFVMKGRCLIICMLCFCMRGVTPNSGM
ncbi:hypothetical protein CsSME_00052294 [Camellia sinensis var. sinensis]